MKMSGFSFRNALNIDSKRGLASSRHCFGETIIDCCAPTSSPTRIMSAPIRIAFRPSSV